MPTIYNPNKRKGLFFIPSGAIKSESAAFSYSQDSYRVDESNPTPTITGDTGGTFTATPEGLTLNSSTGEITLSSSVVSSYVVTYTLPSGTFESRSLGITAAAFSSTRSFSFDGVNDYFEIPKNSSLSLIDTNFSISIWLNPNISHNGLVMQNYFGLNGWGVFYQSGNIRFYDAPVWTTLTTINTSQWNHILIVGDYSGSNLICYKNGVEVYNSSHTFTITESIVNVFIGSERGAGFFYNGNIDEVAIWNSTALSSAAATEIYNSGVPNDLDELTNASDPTAWYRMGE